MNKNTNKTVKKDSKWGRTVKKPTKTKFVWPPIKKEESVDIE